MFTKYIHEFAEDIIWGFLRFIPYAPGRYREGIPRNLAMAPTKRSGARE